MRHAWRDNGIVNFGREREYVCVACGEKIRSSLTTGRPPDSESDDCKNDLGAEHQLPPIHNFGRDR